MMAEPRVTLEQLLAVCLQRINMEEDALSTELRFVEAMKNFEEVRKKWLHVELELKKYKELLVKSDVAKAALEVKLKHTRNQLDVEMKKRYKIEADYHYLERQMQLMCDILVHDSKSNACLNDEQKSLLATFEYKGGNVTQHKSSKRLSVIDESSFLSHSDISYDRTDDDVDLDTTILKPLRSRARERRRSSMALAVCAPALKRGRHSNLSAELLERKSVEKEAETIVKTSLVTPVPGGQIHVVVGLAHDTPEKSVQTLIHECAVSVGETGGGEEAETIVKTSLVTPVPGGQIHVVVGLAHDTPEKSVQTLIHECAVSVGETGGDQTSVWAPCDETNEVEMENGSAVTAASTCRAEKTLKHVFVSKTVIWTEMCSLCGKRVRFGKMVAKCRNCRVVVHQECQQKLTDGCSPTITTTGATTQMDSLEDFAPVTHPRVPQLIVECVTEIERRGLEERGLYRVPGGERLVRELRDEFMQGKTPLMLSKVNDIHVVCGLLKDFLRKLKEPLLTFKLHRTFMEASELPDEDNSCAVMYQAVAELPKANRDTLAFLMLHLQKVMKRPQCQMDRNNLARVFGPTIVGHEMSEPSPSTILRDINTQPKVICRLLSLPEDYWKCILDIPTDQTSSSKANSQNPGRGRLFRPLTSPEMKSHRATPSSSSLRGRIRNLENTVTNTGRVPQGRKFFASPT
uniref:rac GTPase-activating protein 1 n=1 Tax=Monopterus albus TaxID=43700 RepID=UPI0009B3ACF5|nr:rac GTPase-activating protein 1-like [Monopterus albus]